MQNRDEGATVQKVLPQSFYYRLYFDSKYDQGLMKKRCIKSYTNEKKAISEVSPNKTCMKSFESLLIFKNSLSTFGIS